MNEIKAQDRLVAILLADRARMAILKAVAQLYLPDAYVAAGFLRNLAWDDCHTLPGEPRSVTPLNDVDVIYFDRRSPDGGSLDTEDPMTAAKTAENRHCQALTKALPSLQWDVKNQARMHLRNHHSPYQNCTDAMSYWPEKETAVGVRLTQAEQFEFAAPFGLARLFDFSISYNHQRERGLFEQRVKQKQWLETWPKLRLQY